MSFFVKKTEYTPPPEGIFRGVCVDLVTGLKVQTPWGLKDKVKLFWEIDEPRADGKPFVVQKSYTPSLDSKSNLYKDLLTWRGKAFSDEELKGFDLEKVVGVSCQIVIQHRETEKGTFANVMTVTRLMKNMEPLRPSGNYVRVKDRAENQDHGAAADGEQNQQHPSDESQDAGDDIPF